MIQRVDSMPLGLKKIERENGKIVLAHGEVTGHAHAIDCESADHYGEAGADVTYLEIKEALAALRHEEHSTINLPAGHYRIVRQREYSPEAIRRVAD